MKQIKYLQNPWDNALILSAMAKVAYNLHEIDQDEHLVLAALRRANPALAESTPEEISDYLQTLNDAQLVGLANNVKGITHEMQFVEIENEDGDTITAAIHPETNHEGTDVILSNSETGELTEVQLKATDNSGYINEWVEEHPEGEILVTEEVAEKMNLETSGINNEELTTDVNGFLDKLQNLSDHDQVWDYIPELSAVSISIASYHLVNRYRQGEISMKEFKHTFLRLTGTKVSKLVVISLLLLVPVVNVIVGAAVLYQFLYGVGTAVNKYQLRKLSS